MNAEVSVIILTLNEEENIRHCLESMIGWTDDIHVVDSNSTDDTVSIARDYTDNIHIVDEDHWANIRNRALYTLDLENEWVFFVDADERPSPELKKEIASTIPTGEYSGFYIPRKFIFLGTWLKHGRMYTDVLRLFRQTKTEYVESGDAEYATVDGGVGTLTHDLIHEDLKPFSRWISKHNRISSRAIRRYLQQQQGETHSLVASFRGNSTIEGGTRHVIRELIWDNIPLLARPFLIFFYTYFLLLGFLDGVAGLVYHLHHKFWYRLLIYTKVKELENRESDESAP